MVCVVPPVSSIAIECVRPEFIIEIFLSHFKVVVCVGSLRFFDPRSNLDLCSISKFHVKG